MNSSVTREANSMVERWLWLGAVLVAAMVLVGGITRLTGSGLSITQWRPISGALPPMSDNDWQNLFDQYRASPQFRLVNSHFDLAAFKSIFWWEWIHRLLGRIIGVVFFVPLVVFWRKKFFSQWLTRRVIVIFLLGGFQGFLGWFMVASGLVSRPSVSHVRLAAHLLTAFLTFSLIVWTALEVRMGRVTLQRVVQSKVVGLWIFTALLIVQITWGRLLQG